jgi:hypothetical protein
MTEAAKTAEQFFDETLAWLETTYWEHSFYLERDIVWTVQRELTRRIIEAQSHYLVHNDYPMIPGNRRSLSTDIAVVEPSGAVALAVEFKYEPSHSRPDLLQAKLPVVFWGSDGVAKDIARIREYVQIKKARTAIAIFIDEGGYFVKRDPHPGSHWRKWAGNAYLLYAEAQ